MRIADRYVRNTTARAFSVVAAALGIPAMVRLSTPFVVVCRLIVLFCRTDMSVVAVPARRVLVEEVVAGASHRCDFDRITKLIVFVWI
jgi:hypothetical protein